jgi:hypothetical protein
MEAPNPIHFAQHLAGRWTLGVYAADPATDTAKWACVDSDSPDGFDRLYKTQHDLRERFGIHSLLECSRRGGHLWIFTSESCRNRNFAWRLAWSTKAVFELEHADLFPKENGLGGCVRLPFGIHRKIGHCYPLWDHRTDDFSNEVNAALELIASIPDTGYDQIDNLYQEARRVSPEERRTKMRAANTRLPLKVYVIRNTITIERLGFQPSRTGMMSCPLHPPDRHPSFHWNEAERLWCCFHTDPPTGGDIADLYRRTRGITRDQAVDELYAFALKLEQEAPLPPAS